MTLHYHGTPITPKAVMLTLAGRCFCVSFYRPDQVRLAHEIGQSVMLDNGAFSAWTRGLVLDDAYWARFYAWADRWLDHPTTWAVIPDVIDGGPDAQDALIRQWPHGRERAAPVWHMDEPIERLLSLIDEFPRVCIGSTAEFSRVLSAPWIRRMDAAWNAIAARHARTPWVHMLRGLSLSGREWPFASLDSTDIARNHNAPHNNARAMADRWDGAQTPARWAPRAVQADMFDGAAA